MLLHCKAAAPLNLCPCQARNIYEPILKKIWHETQKMNHLPDFSLKSSWWFVCQMVREETAQCDLQRVPARWWGPASFSVTGFVLKSALRCLRFGFITGQWKKPLLASRALRSIAGEPATPTEGRAFKGGFQHSVERTQWRFVLFSSHPVFTATEGPALSQLPVAPLICPSLLSLSSWNCSKSNLGWMSCH